MFKFTTKRDFLYIFLMCGFLVLNVWCSVSVAEYTGKLFGYAYTENVIWKNLWRDAGIMLSFVIGLVLSNVIATLFNALFATRYCTNMRNKFFLKVNNMSFTEVGGFSIPSLITRCTNDSTQFMNTLSSLNILVAAPISIIWNAKKIAGISGQLTLMTTITIVALIVVILLVMLYVIPKFIKIQKTADKMNLVSRENLSGVRVIRAFNAENHQKKQFESVNRQNFKLNTGLHRTMGILFPLITLFISGLVLGIYLMAAALIDNGGLQPLSASSVISTFVQLSVNILFAVLQCVMFFTGLPRGIVSFKRINEVMNTKLPISDPAKPVYFKGKGTVEFKNVSFAYKGADGKVLSNISLKIERGQTVAFIGSTGCGKSTLVNLIPRFADVSKGQILVDGVDIRNVKQDDLHNIIGFVPQRSSLFTGTVASNIKFGKNMNDEKMVIAAKIAQADEFINKLPKKYNSEVAQGGTNFSGGQKQRLCIARALALEPEIFIFDDSFSALDYRTDQIVRAEIKNKMKDVTNIIVAQRIGTILNADNIFVIDKGRIVGEGTHNELMKNCKVYQQIAYSQLSTTELDKISQGGTRV